MAWYFAALFYSLAHMVDLLDSLHKLFLQK